MSANSKIGKSLLFTLTATVLAGSAFYLNPSSTVRAASPQAGYTSEYSSKEEALKAGLELNERICEEGMVLVKNNDTLPLETVKGTAATKVSLFGFAQVRADGGGNGSSDGSAGQVKMSSNIYTSLEDAGYVINPVLREQYAEWSMVEGKRGPKYKNDADVKALFEEEKPNLEASFSEYGDAAIVMLKNGTVSATNPYNLAFDESQYELLKYVEDNFDKVIVLINNSRPVELRKLEKDPKVDSILVVGNPGDNGFDAVGKILNGSVNPSGRLSDIYPTDLKTTPSYENYNVSSKNRQNWIYTIDGKETDTYMVDYEEGIYVGYRYYETRGAEELKKAPDSTWYEDNVVYPFGHGLSYTSFEWKIESSTTGSLTEASRYDMKVKVTNTGKRAGKDVVELYATTPYTTGGIEKSEVVLADFAKTRELQPGESQVVKLSLDLADIASYDWNDANNNGFKGYELEKGDYTFSIRNSSHKAVDSKKITLASDLRVEKSKATGNTIENRFEEVNAYVTENQKDLLSRKDLSKRTTSPTAEELAITAEEHKKWECVVDEKYDTNAPWSTATMPNYDKDPSKRESAKAPVQLSQLVGKDYDDPLWNQLLDQLSIKEMELLINTGGFGTISLDYIGKPYAKDTDGPKGWSGKGTDGQKLNMFAAEPVIAATFNKELAYEMGEIIGEQGIWGNSDVTDFAAGEKIYSYTGWYAPAMNTHRSPFDGRYTEYYSEDGYLAGQMAANASLGASSKGSYVFIKHFALHDDGGGMGFRMKPDGGFEFIGYRGGTGPRSGMSVWCNEQAMREVYFKPFQIAVEDGHATACMSAFNRVGYTWCGGSYELLTELLRNEWGFKGMVVTDLSMYGYMNADQMIRAGGDIILTGSSAPVLFGNEYTKSLPAAQVLAMRNATKNVLYTVCNSHAMQIPQNAAVYFEENELEAVNANQAFTLELGTAALNTTHKYSDIKYEIVEDNMDGKATIDEATGTLSVQGLKAGTYTVTVRAKADGYMSATRSYTVVVNGTDEVLPKPSQDDEAREQIKDLQGKLEQAQKDLDDANSKLASANTLATTSLVIAIISVVAVAGVVVLYVLKARK